MHCAVWFAYAVHPGLVTWIVVGALASAPTRVAPPDPVEVESAAAKTPDDASSTTPADAPTQASDAATPVEQDEAASTVETAPATTPVARVPAPRVDAPARRELDEPPVVTRGARVAYLVSGAVVLAGAGVALGFMGFFVAESKRIEREGHDRVAPAPADVDAASLQDLVDDGVRANRRAIGFGVAGALATSTAVALLVLGARKSNRPGVSASVGRGGAGLVWTRRF